MPASTGTAGAAVVSPEVDEALAESKKNDLEVCRTAFSTLLQITENVEKNPLEPKFRRIKMKNAALVEKVMSCDGGAEFLLATGWSPATVAGEDVWLLSEEAALQQGLVKKCIAEEYSLTTHVRQHIVV